MVYDNNNTIQISVSEFSPYVEGICYTGGDILPGYLLRFAPVVIGSNFDEYYDRHSISEGPAQKLFAIENPYHGDDISATYVEGDRMRIRNCRGGDRILAWVDGTEQIEPGYLLVSNGSGELKLAPVGNINVVAVSLESIPVGPVSVRCAIVVV